MSLLYIVFIRLRVLMDVLKLDTCFIDIFFLFFYDIVCPMFFFFFQAEDGIRDKLVTGVQTCALPISGIGGMFYMVSAILMPFHAAHRTVRRRRDPGLAAQPPVQWRGVFRQFMIAVGIIAALWVTGWGLGAVLTAQPSALGEMHSRVTGRSVTNVIKIGALFLSIGTLCVVLLTVQIGRLFVNRRVTNATTANALLAAVFFLSASSTEAQTPQGKPQPLAQSSRIQSKGVLDAQLAIAETAYQDGDTARAAAGYERVLALDPDNPQALFRLGQLGRHDAPR